MYNGTVLVPVKAASPAQEALKFVRKYGTEKVRLLEFVRNRGKGGAIRMVRLWVFSLPHTYVRIKLTSSI